MTSNHDVPHNRRIGPIALLSLAASLIVPAVGVAASRDAKPSVTMVHDMECK